MAFANSLLSSSSSSSLPQIHHGSKDFNSTPLIISPREPSVFSFSPIRNKFCEPGIGIIGSSRKKNILYSSVNDLNASASSTSLKPEQDADSVPMPVVLIDQDSDSDATIVQLSFGGGGPEAASLINFLEMPEDICFYGTVIFINTEIVDIDYLTDVLLENIWSSCNLFCSVMGQMNALKVLGLDVAKGTVLTDGPVKQTKFFITRLDTGRKVEDPDMLERIRLTIINNLLKYHPESSERLAMGEAFGIKAPEKKLDVDIATQVHVKEDGPKRSLLCIETADRPGLLVEIIKIIADVNIDVESAEIDTEGLVAKDKFHVSYRGAALTSSLSQVLVNCLRYYLRRPETDIDSY
ncbi:hypothetical protein SADUNF_Sadunf10G0185500 [Salix dunnii]|uniref:ACT domain-containing protein ACR n=1 Tax=Salix dunnii TaxID=1413687 RepID=A0A835JUK6_9ROSI|nr:hypothetical protein SADUNF_Sadunf10G0185500 [Salix dunnii]